MIDIWNFQAIASSSVRLWLVTCANASFVEILELDGKEHGLQFHCLCKQPLHVYCGYSVVLSSHYNCFSKNRRPDFHVRIKYERISNPVSMTRVT